MVKNSWNAIEDHILGAYNLIKSLESEAKE